MTKPRIAEELEVQLDSSPTVALQTVGAHSSTPGIEAIILPDIAGEITPPQPVAEVKRSSSLKDAYLDGRLHVVTDHRITAHRIEQFHATSQMKYGGMITEAFHKDEFLGNESRRERPSESLQEARELYARFADVVTPREFEDLNAKIRDPVKGPFAEEMWDILTGKLKHEPVTREVKNSWYLKDGELCEGQGTSKITTIGQFYSQEELSAEHKKVVAKQDALLEKTLSRMKFFHVHDKIASYLAKELADEASDIPYVADRIKALTWDNNGNPIDDAKRTASAIHTAVRDLIDRTIAHESRLEENLETFEQMWVKERRYANYLEQVETSVREGMWLERDTNTLWKAQQRYQNSLRSSQPGSRLLH